MKLFIFRPIEYGPLTYIVMAEDEQQARTFVKTYQENEDWGTLDIQTSNGKEMYELEIYEMGQVAVNPNA